ncbi:MULTISPECIES: EamA family transporter [unclassified Halomonas]|uniref:EamA family transporter n=2 Tax=Halomonadaceae TaxID=28256 RepID=UPI00406C6B5C
MLASTCWACSTVLSKKFAMTLSPWIVTFWQMLIGSLLLMVIAAFSKQPFSCRRMLTTGECLCGWQFPHRLELSGFGLRR